MRLHYDEAFSRRRANSCSIWSPNTPDDDPSAFASGRIYEGFADIRSPVNFTFAKDQKFFCVGSCFAREIEEAIAAQGGCSATREGSLALIAGRPDLFELRAGLSGLPNAFLNRYNVPSMALLIEDIVSDILESKLLFGAAEKKSDFHYTRGIVFLDTEQSLERRQLLRRMYADALRESDIFIFTLGLCESFFDIDDQAYLNITPDPRAAAGHNLEFRFVDLNVNLDALRSIVGNIRALKPDAQIVLTVSPVPLDLTFTGMDIIVANSMAKSILIAAAHLACSEFDGCYYFPSFEMVTNSAQALAWEKDKRHVARPMVENIMRSFMRQHMAA